VICLRYAQSRFLVSNQAQIKLANQFARKPAFDQSNAFLDAIKRNEPAKTWPLLCAKQNFVQA
jgi:hypothetical protein